MEPEISLSKIDPNAIWVVKHLRSKGYEAYLTGGCVRDLLLKKTPKDFDVATNAKPEEVRQIFRNSRLIGRRFLLAHVFFPGNKIIETATFRANPLDIQDDLPEDLLLTQDNVYGSIEEDAKRRDLTINGLFYDPIEEKIVDYVGGCADLELGLIRTIGDPDIRFQEDPVRILRAIKFASRLGFSIEDQTAAAMKKHVGEIARCAPARIQEELFRLLTSGHAARAFALCKDFGILDLLLPELLDAPLSLEALDAAVAREVHISTSVAFSMLLLPAYLALEKSEQNERHWIDKLCVSLAERIRLPRHDQDCIRSILSTVSDFKPVIIQKSWFREALLVYTLHLYAHQQSLEPIQLLKSMASNSNRLYKQEKRGFLKSKPRFRRKRSPSQFRSGSRHSVTHVA